MEFLLSLWQRLIRIQSFYGFDNHAESIEYARNKAKEEGLDEDRITFQVAPSTNFPMITNEGYDLIAYFDCLHDMEDPEGAAGICIKSIKEA